EVAELRGARGPAAGRIRAGRSPVPHGGARGGKGGLVRFHRVAGRPRLREPLLDARAARAGLSRSGHDGRDLRGARAARGGDVRAGGLGPGTGGGGHGARAMRRKLKRTAIALLALLVGALGSVYLIP